MAGGPNHPSAALPMTKADATLLRQRISFQLLPFRVFVH
jgi:hypothetical protein